MSATTDEGEHVIRILDGTYRKDRWRAYGRCTVCGSPVVYSVEDGWKHEVDDSSPGEESNALRAEVSRLRERSIRTLQTAVAAWSLETFGNNENNRSKVTGHPMGSLNDFFGLVEEVGELARTIICSNQGRKGYDDPAKRLADRKDAVADIMIFLMNFCEREGIDLEETVYETWTKIVSKRTLKNWEEHAHDKPEPNVDTTTRDDLTLLERAFAVGFHIVDGALIKPGHRSEHWAASWRPVRWRGWKLRLPSYLKRVVEELEGAKLNPPNAESQLRNQNGVGWAEPTQEEVDDLKATKTEWLELDPGVMAKYRPAIRDIEEAERANNYARDCIVCGKVRVHKQNRACVCPDCYPRYAAEPSLFNKVIDLTSTKE